MLNTPFHQSNLTGTKSYLKFVSSDAAVGVDDQGLAGDGTGFPDLGGDEDANGGHQLELGLVDLAVAQEPVHDVDCQAEDLRLAVLLPNDFQHPVSDRLPHVSGDASLLNSVQVIRDYGKELFLIPQQVLEYPVVLDLTLVFNSPDSQRVDRFRLLLLLVHVVLRVVLDHPDVRFLRSLEFTHVQDLAAEEAFTFQHVCHSDAD